MTVTTVKTIPMKIATKTNFKLKVKAKAKAKSKTNAVAMRIRIEIISKTTIATLTAIATETLKTMSSRMHVHTAPS